MFFGFVLGCGTISIAGWDRENTDVLSAQSPDAVQPKRMRLTDDVLDFM